MGFTMILQLALFGLLAGATSGYFTTSPGDRCFVCPSEKDREDAPCYPYEWYCDGWKDCPTGIDEAEEVCGTKSVSQSWEGIKHNLHYIGDKVAQRIIDSNKEYVTRIVKHSEEVL